MNLVDDSVGEDAFCTVCIAQGAHGLVEVDVGWRNGCKHYCAAVASKVVA